MKGATVSTDSSKVAPANIGVAWWTEYLAQSHRQFSELMNQARELIDHVAGIPDLEARVVRTIGDPDIRFREDPIRILRAVKFAARCDLTIEPETYRRMMEHSGEIAKCAQARVSEEFYRLLRAGAAPFKIT